MEGAAPNILQVLALSGGRVVVITEDEDSASNSPARFPAIAGDVLSLLDSPRKVRGSAGSAPLKFLSPVAGLPDAPLQALAAGKNGAVLAGFFGQGVYASKDGGDTWHEENEGLADRFALTVGVGPDGAMFAGTYGGGLFRKSIGDNLRTSVKLADCPETIQTLALNESGVLAAGSREKGAFVFHGLKNSQETHGGFPKNANVHSLAFGDSNVLYAGVYGKGLFVSKDRGKSWQAMPFAYLSRANRIAVGSDGFWCAIIEGVGLIVTSDRGESWTQPVLPFSTESGLSTAIDRENRLFAGSPKHGVFLSSDFGATWTSAKDGLPGDGASALKSDPAGRIYAAAAEGDGLFVFSEAGIWPKITASDEYGGNYTCWNIRFFTGIGNVAYGYQDILIANEGSDLWERTRFGQGYE